MYTDDPIMAVVGVDRAIRLLRLWTRLTAELGLIMAIPEKRSLGTWAPWLGVLLLAGLGLVLVPKAKLLRTVHRIDELLTDGLPFQDYRSLIGLLEHLRCVYAAAASTMYGLYSPHGSLRVQQEGPAALIRPNGFQVEQLKRHRASLINTGGAPVTVVLRRDDGVAPAHLAVKYVVSADAATDSEPPGIGGFCHGLYWYVALPLEWLVYLHITVLELLASGVGAITLAPYLRHAQRIRLQSDALATPFVLSRQRARSPMLQYAHHQLLQDPRYKAVADNADIQHLDGDSNPFSDSVSRALWPRFQLLCRAAGIQPVHVPVPAHARALLQRVADMARHAGVRINTSQYRRPDPVLPPAMLMLGRRSSACDRRRTRSPPSALASPPRCGPPLRQRNALRQRPSPTASSTVCGRSHRPPNRGRRRPNRSRRRHANRPRTCVVTCRS